MSAATGFEEAAASGGRNLVSPRSQNTRSGLLTAIVCCCLTGTIVVAGSAVGLGYLPPSELRGHVFDKEAGPYANWDGQWYELVASKGYFYRDGDHSSVNFFPAYPILARALARSTGMSYDLALVILSNCCLLFTFVILFYYLADRAQTPPGYLLWVFLSLGLAPTAFFFRMAYSESLMLLTTAIFLLALRRRWSLPVLAIITGLATATRPVGIVLLPPFALEIWRRVPNVRAFVVRLLLLTPLATWGLVAFMAYQAVALGNPLAFVKSHASWDQHHGAGIEEKLESLLALEPVWTRFVRSSPGYWALHDKQDNPLFSLYLADPFYFLVASLMIAVGMAKRWLDPSESLVAVAMMALPVATKAFETNMEGFGRYGFATLPVFLVAGHLLCRAPTWAAIGVLSISGTMMFVYSALFVQWYAII